MLKKVRLYSFILTLLIIAVLGAITWGENAGCSGAGLRIKTIAGGGTSKTTEDPLELDLGRVNNLTNMSGQLLVSTREGAYKMSLSDKIIAGKFSRISDLLPGESKILGNYGSLLYFVNYNGLPLIYSIDLNSSTLSKLAGGGYLSGRAEIGINAEIASLGGSAFTGEYLYFSDFSKLKKMSLSAPYSVDFVAGNDIPGYKDGMGSDAAFSRITSLLLIGNDKRLLIADLNNNVIRELNIATNEVKTFAGKYFEEGTAEQEEDNANLLQARFLTPRSMAINSRGDIFVGGSEVSLLRIIEFKDGKWGAVSTMKRPINNPEAGPISADKLVFIEDKLYFTEISDSSTITQIAFPEE